MASHRCIRSEAAMNDDMMETFRAMARVVKEQATTTTSHPSTWQTIMATGMGTAMGRWTMST